MNSSPFSSVVAATTASIFVFVGLAASAAPAGKIEICHKPGTRAQKILLVDENSGADHFGHGDYLVEPEVCDGLDSDCEKPPVADNDVDCSDGIACTVDSCAGVAGCFSNPDDTLCDDDDPGTLDECSVVSGGCINTPVAATVDIVGGGTVQEGDSIEFALRLDRAVQTTVFVFLSFRGIGDDPATVNTDYAAPSGSVAIAPGQSLVSFSVSTLDDSIVEPTEAFEIVIQDVSSPHLIGNDTAQGFIRDNDEPLVISNFQAVSVGSNTITLQLTSSEPAECEALYRIQGVEEYQSGGSADSDPDTGAWLFVVPTPLNGGLSSNTTYELNVVCTNEQGASATTNTIVVRTRR